MSIAAPARSIMTGTVWCSTDRQRRRALVRNRLFIAAKCGSAQGSAQCGHATLPGTTPARLFLVNVLALF